MRDLGSRYPVLNIVNCWSHRGVVYRMLTSLYQSHAVKEHWKYFQVLQRECGYSEHNIPQLEDVSNFLKRNDVVLRHKSRQSLKTSF